MHYQQQRLCIRLPWQVRAIVPLICACFLLALIGAAAGAEEVSELWRGGGFDWPQSVSGLYRAGVAQGCATQPLRYCPTSGVSREMMAVFLCRAFEISTP